MIDETKIYEQFARATSQFSAYAILYKGEPVGKCVVKFSREGGKTAYVRLHGCGMKKASAWQFSSAIEQAFDKLNLELLEGTKNYKRDVAQAIKELDCRDISDAFRRNGFVVVTVI